MERIKDILEENGIRNMLEFDEKELLISNKEN